MKGTGDGGLNLPNKRGKPGVDQPGGKRSFGDSYIHSPEPGGIPPPRRRKPRRSHIAEALRRFPT